MQVQNDISQLETVPNTCCNVAVELLQTATVISCIRKKIEPHKHCQALDRVKASRLEE